MKNNLRFVLIFSLVFALLSLAGCSQYDNNGGFPSLFGPMRYAEPGYVSSIFNSTIRVYTKEIINGYSTEISSACINFDPTNMNLVDYTSEPDYYYNNNGGYVEFLNVAPGRHMIKATHPDYDDITEIINVPGDGAEHEYTIIMSGKTSTNQPVVQTFDPDQYETRSGYNDNNTFYNATDINYLGNFGYGEVDTYLQSSNFNLDADFHNTADEDWYKVSVYYGTYHIYVTLKNIPSGSNYDIEIYNYNYNKLDGSYNSATWLLCSAKQNIGEGVNSYVATTDEQISYYPNYIYYGYLYIRVFRVSGDPTSNQYRLHIEGIN